MRNAYLNLEKFYQNKTKKHHAFVWEALCGNKELTTRLGRRALQFNSYLCSDQLWNFTVNKQFGDKS